jgi:DNA mismatch endonuclease (patch repair protein)
VGRVPEVNRSVTDNLDRVARSHAMRQVRSRNTTPELTVRQILRELGFRGYRVHRRDLPGNPDVVWLGKRRALFVHGCFWHGHRCKRGRRMPATNRAYWSAKILRNRARDAKARAALRKNGWDVIVIWECELRRPERLESRLRQGLG